MNPSGNLDRFLQNSSSLGQTVDTDQSFSVSKEKALEKLASFQLPFEGAWALKIVQCAVAGGSFDSIKVELMSKETRFTFTGQPDFTLAEVEQAFFDPNYSARTDLVHLVTALRVVGLKDRHPFVLSLAGEPQLLGWDGEEMVNFKSHTASAEAFCLSVSTQPKEKRSRLAGLFSIMAGAGPNAQLTRVLTNLAYVCPYPLVVDGRRVDALQNDPIHGWGPESQLLMMSYRDGPMPAMSLPPYSWEYLKPKGLNIQGGLEKASREIRKPSEEGSTYSLAFLFSAHLKWTSENKQSNWQELAEVCHLNWVLDGVIVQREALTQDPLFCSAGCFVSAEGLPTDITGLQLQEGPEKTRREKEARGILIKALADTEKLDFEAMQRDFKSTQKVTGGLLLVFGTLCFVVSPVVGLIFGGAGVVSFFADSDAEARRQQVAQCVAYIRAELKSTARRRR